MFVHRPRSFALRPLTAVHRHRDEHNGVEGSPGANRIERQLGLDPSADDGGTVSAFSAAAEAVGSVIVHTPSMYQRPGFCPGMGRDGEKADNVAWNRPSRNGKESSRAVALAFNV